MSTADTETRKTHPLVDTTEPNLLEDVFDYNLPPKIRFDGPMIEYIDGKEVQFDPNSAKARDIFVTDTTFRDGQQARPPYSIEQMVHLYDLMAKLGGPNGVIRQTEFFLYTKNDRETLDRCRELNHEFPECTGWIRAVKGDFRLVKEAALANIAASNLRSPVYHKIWSRADSNRRHLTCKASALPTELRPQWGGCRRRDAGSRGLPRIRHPASCILSQVGAPRFELGTSALSGLRSNQLSYAPGGSGCQLSAVSKTRVERSPQTNPSGRSLTAKS